MWTKDMVSILSNSADGGVNLAQHVSSTRRASGVDPQRALFVDVGGGTGPQCKEFKEKYLTLPGRVILEGLLKTVLPHAGSLEGIETIEHDFFTLNPVKGAVLLPCA